MKRYIPIFIVLVTTIAVVIAYAQTFTSRTQNIGGMQVGEVVIDNQVPVRLRYSAGGLSPAERALIVARRLSQISNLAAGDITVGRVGAYWGVLARGELLITADNSHAIANNTTPYGLAVSWANQLRGAIAGSPINPTPEKPVPVEASPETIVNTSQKVVPIISVGSGIRIGAALVAGSEEQVAKVNAVAQVEGDFQDRVRLRALVPIDSENVIGNLRRVPGTAVIAVADVRL